MLNKNHPKHSHRQHPTVLTMLCVVATLYLLIIIGIGVFITQLWWLASWHVLISLISFAWYAKDKMAAINNGRRTPENTLHLIDVLGGWIGASFAHKFLNHKSTKTKFRVLFYATIAINITATLAGLYFFY